MTDISENIFSFENEISESKENVKQILQLAEFQLDTLEGKNNPNVLVLGTGPHLPEALLLRDWAEEKNKAINVTCVDKMDIDKNYLNILLNIKNSNNFKMEYVKSDFENFTFGKYDLVFLLRFSNLSLISDSVFNNIVESLNDGGIFLMSGGLNERFAGLSLHNSKISLEINKEIPYSDTDYYKSYGGTNRVLKFSKIGNAI